MVAGVAPRSLPGWALKVGSMRWSEDQLRRVTGKGVVRATTALGPGQGRDPLAVVDGEAGEKSGKAAFREAKSHMQRAIESIERASVTGTYVKGESIDLYFEGAMLLSPNMLFALTHWERIPYRKAWHEKIYWAVMEITKGPAHLQTLDYFDIIAKRVSPKLCDTDALQGYFKFPIDGLRYARIIEDDKPKHFHHMEATQAQGEYAAGLRVVRVDRAKTP